MKKFTFLSALLCLFSFSLHAQMEAGKYIYSNSELKLELVISDEGRTISSATLFRNLGSKPILGKGIFREANDIQWYEFQTAECNYDFDPAADKLLLTEFDCKNGLPNRKYELRTGINTQEKSIPDMKKIVNDLEDILSSKEEKTLTEKIKAISKLNADEIAIVNVKSFDPYENLEDYAFAIINEWNLGGVEKKSILIIVSKQERKVRIETSYGVSDRLTDEETKIIIETIMIPEFKAGKYFEGIDKGLNAIKGQLQ